MVSGYTVLQSTKMLPFCGFPDSQLSNTSFSASSEKTQEKVTVHCLAMSAGDEAHLAPFSNIGSAFECVRLNTNNVEPCLNSIERQFVASPEVTAEEDHP